MSAGAVVTVALAGGLGLAAVWLIVCAIMGRQFDEGFFEGYKTGALRQAQKDGTEIVVGKGAAHG